MNKFLLLLTILCFSQPTFAGTQAFFTPSYDCENNIISLIKVSKKIDVAVYCINNEEIINALIYAHANGADIRILTDKKQTSKSCKQAVKLWEAGIPFKVHTKHKIEHNKFAIFDNNVIETGSYNWTNSASQKNSENCLFVNETDTTVKYNERFEYLWEVNDLQKSENWLIKKFK